MLAVFAEAGTTGATVSSVSGGGVSTWTKGVQFIGTGGVDTEIWFGKVTTTGASTITFTWSGSIAGHTTEYGAQEFSAGAGGVDGVGPRQVRHHQRAVLHHGAVPEPAPRAAPASSTSATPRWPTPPPPAATPGFTYVVTTNGNVVTYDPTVSGTVAPTATQSPAGVSTAVGVLLSASTGAPPPFPPSPA